MQDASEAPMFDSARSCPYGGGQYWGLNCNQCFEDRERERRLEFSQVEAETERAG